MRGFQLWINLPAREKMSDPAYQEIAPEAVPRIEDAGVTVGLLSGKHRGRRGPIEDPHTDLRYLDVGLEPDRRFEHALDPAASAFAYVLEGGARITGREVPGHHLAVLGEGDRVEVTSGPAGARLILVAGRPLGEPIVQYGPFVMSSRAEIEQALADYRDGRLVRDPPRIDRA